MKHGEGWLAAHPKREAITHRYLKHRYSLAREALARLAEQDDQPADDVAEARPEGKEEVIEKPLRLNDQRLGDVAAALKASGAKRVLDLGCGEGKLLRELLKEKQFEEIVGMDVAVRALEIAKDRLRLDDLPPRQKDRIRLLHGSLMYRDKRLAGFDAAAVVEVVEHLDPPRLAAFERVLFEFARPATVVLTTPNREYNVYGPICRPGPFGTKTTVLSGRGQNSAPGRRALPIGSDTRSSFGRSGRNMRSLDRRRRWESSYTIRRGPMDITWYRLGSIFGNPKPPAKVWERQFDHIRDAA